MRALSGPCSAFRSRSRATTGELQGFSIGNYRREAQGQQAQRFGAQSRHRIIGAASPFHRPAASAASHLHRWGRHSFIWRTQEPPRRSPQLRGRQGRHSFICGKRINVARKGDLERRPITKIVWWPIPTTFEPRGREKATPKVGPGSSPAARHERLRPARQLASRRLPMGHR